jgi:hypothetical protein
MKNFLWGLVKYCIISPSFFWSSMLPFSKLISWMKWITRECNLFKQAMNGSFLSPSVPSSWSSLSNLICLFLEDGLALLNNLRLTYLSLYQISLTSFKLYPRGGWICCSNYFFDRCCRWDTGSISNASDICVIMWETMQISAALRPSKA